jgi:hypothetical protein
MNPPETRSVLPQSLGGVTPRVNAPPRRCFGGLVFARVGKTRWRAARRRRIVAALGLMTLGDGRWRRKGGGRAAALQRFLVDYWSSFYKTSHSAERRGMGHPSRRFSVRQEVRIEERSLVGPECGLCREDNVNRSEERRQGQSWRSEDRHYKGGSCASGKCVSVAAALDLFAENRKRGWRNLCRMSP